MADIRGFRLLVEHSLGGGDFKIAIGHSLRIHARDGVHKFQVGGNDSRDVSVLHRVLYVLWLFKYGLSVIGQSIVEQKRVPGLSVVTVCAVKSFHCIDISHDDWLRANGEPFAKLRIGHVDKLLHWCSLADNSPVNNLVVYPNPLPVYWEQRDSVKLDYGRLGNLSVSKKTVYVAYAAFPYVIRH